MAVFPGPDGAPAPPPSSSGARESRPRPQPRPRPLSGRLSRRRLGVALLLERPLADRVEGLRMALGDPTLGRVPPHLTLVPPVNVRSAQLPDALALLRSAARAQSRPITLTLGPPRTFLPANPVLYLSIGGELDRLRRLRDMVFSPPLERTLSWPWVPHVTLLDGGSPERIKSAESALDRFASLASFDRVVLLEESHRTWRPIADVTLGAPAVVGTGGLALEVTRGQLLDPEAKAIVDRELGAAWPPKNTDLAPVVLTGRREGRPVGVAAAWHEADAARVAVVVEPAARRQGVGRTLLGQLEATLASAGWSFDSLSAVGPQEFYASTTAWVSRTPQMRTERASSAGGGPR